MLEKLETELKIRGFTDATLKNYVIHNKRFLAFIGKTPEDVASDDVKKYMAYLMSEKKQKPASVNLALSSLKFFYEQMLKKSIFAEIKAPKIEKKLPIVLTKEEVKKLIDACTNKKHKLLIELLYSSGLRVSEAVKLKVNDIELNEKMGTVRSGKGNKDRLFILSDILVRDIKDYIETRKKNSEYLFTGLKEHMTIRMAQKVVQFAAKKADIKKRVFCHCLRSSFATHLLEDGVDIRYIQQLLGHSNLSTTELYTHVSTKELKKIKSPLDNL